jgi:hypothetical protein
MVMMTSLMLKSELGVGGKVAKRTPGDVRDKLEDKIGESKSKEMRGPSRCEC